MIECVAGSQGRPLPATIFPIFCLREGTKSTIGLSGPFPKELKWFRRSSRGLHIIPCDEESLSCSHVMWRPQNWLAKLNFRAVKLLTLSTMTVSIFGILIYDISNSSHSETACSVIVIPFLDFKRKESATRRKRVQGVTGGEGEVYRIMPKNISGRLLVHRWSL